MHPVLAEPWSCPWPAPVRVEENPTCEWHAGFQSLEEVLLNSAKNQTVADKVPAKLMPFRANPLSNRSVALLVLPLSAIARN